MCKGTTIFIGYIQMTEGTTVFIGYIQISSSLFRFIQSRVQIILILINYKYVIYFNSQILSNGLTVTDSTLDELARQIVTLHFESKERRAYCWTDSVREQLADITQYQRSFPNTWQREEAQLANCKESIHSARHQLLTLTAQHHNLRF